MNIQHKESETKGQFFIEGIKGIAAELTYSKAGSSIIIIDHTEVGEELKGKGIGLQLVNEAVTFARSKKIKILPLCPFAKSVFDKRQEIQDVLTS